MHTPHTFFLCPLTLSGTTAVSPSCYARELVPSEDEMQRHRICTLTEASTAHETHSASQIKKLSHSLSSYSYSINDQNTNTFRSNNNNNNNCSHIPPSILICMLIVSIILQHIQNTHPINFSALSCHSALLFHIFLIISSHSHPITPTKEKRIKEETRQYRHM